MTAALAKVSPKVLGWEPYVYLVYLGFLFFQPLFDPGTRLLNWLLVGLMIALFLPLYFWTWSAQGRRSLSGVAGMALLGAVCTPLNSGASAFFIYAAAAAAFAGSPRFAAKLIAAIFVLSLASAALSGVPWPTWLAAFAPALVFVPIIGGVNIFHAEKERADAKLRLAQGEIERLATVAERERIARDLHDRRCRAVRDARTRRTARRSAPTQPEPRRHAAAAEPARCSGCPPGSFMIRVVIAEDQAMVLGALAALLELEGDLSVVAQARDGAEALTLVRREQPDVLLTDIEMPGLTGLELAADVARSVPKTRVVILTTFARSGYLRRALAAGASGYLLKDAPAPELAAAVRRVYAGGRAIDPELAAEAWGEPDPLSDRERVCLRLAGQGRTSPEIAEALGLSVGTVRNYLSEAIGKLGAGNRVEAARLARDKGWL